ncbi:MAG TPA: LysR substrate-binding domain-containing protein [Actinokineospora sp.]|jgi:DNA-binding transcriptional LysR family regulator|nr:LysR substrate-binding domain-containing protein [Actinokineospora sp.]
MFDLVRLRVLRTVADQGTLAAAAELLHLTPSAVSQQMAKLEREARCALIERHGRRVRLTEEGKLLARHAERILGAVEEAEADLDERRGEVLGEFTVAAFPTAVRGLLPAVVVEMNERYPRLRLHLREVEPYDAIAQLGRGDVDLVIAQDWVNVPIAIPERLRSRDIGQDPVDVALPASHRLVDRPVLTPADLADERWIASTAGTICHDWLVSTFRGSGREPDIVHQAGEFPTQLAMVAAGLGVALIPRLAGDLVPDGVRIRPIEPSMSRRIFAVWREESARRPSVRAFVESACQRWVQHHYSLHV